MYFDFATSKLLSVTPEEFVEQENSLRMGLDSNPDPRIQTTRDEEDSIQSKCEFHSYRKRQRSSSRKGQGQSHGNRHQLERSSPPKKNAVMFLNELMPTVGYTLIQATGPSHSPKFTVQTIINGQSYRGVGRTKRKARLSAATNALLSSIQFPDECLARHVIDSHIPKNTLDFASDTDFLSHRTSSTIDTQEDTSHHHHHHQQQHQHGRGGDLADEGGKTGSRTFLDPLEVPWNPVSILNDIRPQSRYRICRQEPSPGGGVVRRHQRKRICISVTFDGMTFDGFGRCQRSAKQRAAQSALKNYFNLRFLGSVSGRVAPEINSSGQQTTEQPPVTS